MSVYEFLNLATEDGAEVEVWDNATGQSEILDIRDAMDKYGEFEVTSFDSFITNNRLCINIDTEE